MVKTTSTWLTMLGIPHLQTVARQLRIIDHIITTMIGIQASLLRVAKIIGMTAHGTLRQPTIRTNLTTTTTLGTRRCQKKVARTTGTKENGVLRRTIGSTMLMTGLTSGGGTSRRRQQSNKTTVAATITATMPHLIIGMALGVKIHLHKKERPTGLMASGALFRPGNSRSLLQPRDRHLT